MKLHLFEKYFQTFCNRRATFSPELLDTHPSHVNVFSVFISKFIVANDIASATAPFLLLVVCFYACSLFIYTYQRHNYSLDRIFEWDDDDDDDVDKNDNNGESNVRAELNHVYYGRTDYRVCMLDSHLYLYTLTHNTHSRASECSRHRYTMKIVYIYSICHETPISSGC